MIKVANLHKSFRGQQVLKGVNIEFASGKITTIVGTSDAIAESTFSTSLPLKMSGLFCGTFGHGTSRMTGSAPGPS